MLPEGGGDGIVYGNEIKTFFSTNYGMENYQNMILDMMIILRLFIQESLQQLIWHTKKKRECWQFLKFIQGLLILFNWMMFYLQGHSIVPQHARTAIL